MRCRNLCQLLRASPDLMRSKQLSRRPPLLAAHLCCNTRMNSSARQPHTAFGVSQHEACFGTGAEAAEEKCVKLSCPLQPHGSPLREEGKRCPKPLIYILPPAPKLCKEAWDKDRTLQSHLHGLRPLSRQKLARCKLQPRGLEE